MAEKRGTLIVEDELVWCGVDPGAQAGDLSARFEGSAADGEPETIRGTWTLPDGSTYPGTITLNAPPEPAPAERPKITGRIDPSIGKIVDAWYKGIGDA